MSGDKVTDPEVIAGDRTPLFVTGVSLHFTTEA